MSTSNQRFAHLLSAAASVLASDRSLLYDSEYKALMEVIELAKKRI